MTRLPWRGGTRVGARLHDEGGSARVAAVKARRDEGAMALFMVFVGMTFLLVAATVVALTTGVRAVHQAENAADAGALAGAPWAVDGQEVACAEAERLVVANGGRLVSCAVDGLDITVRVEVVSMSGTVGRSAARAGPARDTGSAGGERGQDE